MKMPRCNEFMIAHDQRIKQHTLFPGWSKPNSYPCHHAFRQPVFEWQRNFAEVFLPEHVLVPDDELRNAKLVGERRVDQKIERGIFGVVDGIDCPLRDWCLLARVKYRYDNEIEQNLEG